MVIVVPAFATGEQTDPPDIAAVIAAFKIAITMLFEMAKSIDELWAPENDKASNQISKKCNRSEKCQDSQSHYHIYRQA